MILLPPPVQCIRWYARTRTPTDACSISAVAAIPIWSGLSLLILNRYSTSFGVSLIDRNLHGSTPGASAISSCGIIAAPCTVAMRSTRIRAASCTAPKSRARNDQRKRSSHDPPRVHHAARRRGFLVFLCERCGARGILRGGPRSMASGLLLSTQKKRRTFVLQSDGL